MVLPYLDQSPLYGTFDWNVPLHDARNLAARERHLRVFLCPSDTVSPSGFVEMGPLPERYAMCSYVGSFGPPDLDAVQEQRDGMFSRNSRTRFSDVTDGLTTTLLCGERENGPFRNGAVHGNHFEYETAWSGAIRDWDEPDDDHGHMTLFQTGHTPNNADSDDRDVSAPHVGYANFLMGTAPCGPSRRTSNSVCIKSSRPARVPTSPESFEVVPRDDSTPASWFRGLR